PVPSSMNYGDDAFTFKAEALAARMTWTPQDSLDRYIKGNKITTRAVHPENLMLDDLSPEEKAELAELGGPAKAWDQMYIPWSFNSLVVPYIAASLAKQGDIETNGVPSTRKLKTSADWNLTTTSYLEVQIWGPLTLDDVEAFQFTQDPPSGEFLAELLKR